MIPATISRQFSRQMKTISSRSISSSKQATQRAPKQNFLKQFSENASVRNKTVYSLSLASDESAFDRFDQQNMLSNQMRVQLDHSADQLRRDLARDTAPGSLPRTHADLALHSHQAVVVTDAQIPFRIQYVNRTWEGLCGYSMEDSLGETLDILQGPDTNKEALTAMMSQLWAGEDVGVVVTNYTKRGRRFRNHLRIGPMYEKGRSHHPTHFVGVLQEINDGL